MRQVGQWIIGTLASRREAGAEALGAILFVGSTTEHSPEVALLASESGFSSRPWADNRALAVAAESGGVPETLAFAR